MRSLLLLFAFTYAVLALVPFHQVDLEARVENEYLMVFQYDLEETIKSDYALRISSEGGEVIRKMKIGKLELLHVRMTYSQLSSHLKETAILRRVEENQIVKLAEEETVEQVCTVQDGAIWNLERVSEKTIDLEDSKGYTFENKAGAGVTSYIIDTGIRITHNEFEGRASWGANFADSTNTDCNGHGTHVAGTVAGRLYGVAKKTTLVAVKVLNCGGSGTIAGVIAGIEWVTTNAKKPANANMSLGGGNSATIVEAVENSVASGVVHVVAAGNSNANACGYSPANAPSAITVGATTIDGSDSVQTDLRSSFSNFGPCLDVFAPGQLILSAWSTSDTATNTISGTSMASPHVCGVASLLQADTPTATPDDIADLIVGSATSGIIQLGCSTAVCNSSPNLLLYSACNA